MHSKEKVSDQQFLSFPIFSVGTPAPALTPERRGNWTATWRWSHKHCIHCLHLSHCVAPTCGFLTVRQEHVGGPQPECPWEVVGGLLCQGDALGAYCAQPCPFLERQECGSEGGMRMTTAQEPCCCVWGSGSSEGTQGSGLLC